jgi:glycosyltransferase involved in cell wall biosynthesis
VRILMNAHFCDPEDGSEPGVGWAFASAAARRHETWVLTHSRFRPSIEAALAVAPELDLHPVYLDPAPLEARLHRLSYTWWQHQARPMVRQLHREHRFDVAHHVTVSAAFMPTVLTTLRDVPLVMGPMISVPSPPAKLWRYMGARAVLQEVARNAVGAAGRAAFGRHAARRAAVYVATEPRAFERVGLRADGRRRCVVEPNSALDLSDAPIPDPSRPRHSPPRAMYAGRLLYWKGLRLALHALARPETAEWHLDVFGEGPDEVSLRRLAGRLGVAERVRFHGRVDRPDVLAALADTDAVVMPSLHEGSSWLTAEALSLGAPVVCLDWGGPSVLMELTGQPAVSTGGDVVANFARALAGVEGRRQPTDRFSIDRLPGMVDDWYRSAVAATPALGDRRSDRASQAT